MNNKELYNLAKEAYYNGNPILTDFEFDELEKELGFENKSYVGTRHNPSYTEKHPYIMGSLSKVQIHEKNGIIDWSKYYDEAEKYFHRNGNAPVIVTPKYDGCSFEAVIENGNVISISSRGDGEYGKNLYNHLINKVTDNLLNPEMYEHYVLRGEVLINKDIFANKYSEFVNPRSFVSGILNRDYSTELDDVLNDISIVIYEIKLEHEGNWVDVDWTIVDYKDRPTFYIENETVENSVHLENIYNTFSEYRNVCPFALDGIVIKPIGVKRENNLVEHRPKDCVAIKFIPMLQETEVIDIEWKLGKTGEWNPVVITNPVSMDGKSITRASGHNYGYLVDNKVSIGTKVILSLAGDIIPFIYKITDSNKFSKDNLNIPTNTVIDGCHLMGILTNEEITKLQFINSANILNIPNLGNAETLNIWKYVSTPNTITDEFFDDTTPKEFPNNILFLRPDDIYYGIVLATKNNATGKATKIKKAYSELLNKLTLKDIIKSCAFKLCGDKVAEQCANYLLGVSYDFTSMASEGYTWVKDINSKEYKQMLHIINYLGKEIDDFKIRVIETITDISDKIPVILTGEPNNYPTKRDFLNAHPEYMLTTSWKDVKIVFTNSLESNTGKMKKAKEKNIEIKLY